MNHVVPQDALVRAAAMMNAIGVFEALRVMAEEGVEGHDGAMRCGEHFWVVPYTEHLSRKRAKVGPPPERGMLPTILIPELVLLDVLPDFFRAFCQPYRYALQVGKKRGTGQLLSESKTEQTMRRYFGSFVNEFLNGWLYRMGAESWRQIGALFQSPGEDALTRNPLTKATAVLLAKLRDWPEKLPTRVLRVAASMTSLSMRGMDRGRFQWGLTEVVKGCWPHHPLEVTFPGMERSWARLHPSTITHLGVRCGHLGEDFYLGDEVLQECAVVKVVIETRSPTVFQALKPGPQRDAIALIADTWLHARRLQVSLECKFTGKIENMPWFLGGAATMEEDVHHEPEDDGRLGYTTYLT